MLAKSALYEQRLEVSIHQPRHFSLAQFTLLTDFLYHKHQAFFVLAVGNERLNVWLL